MSSEARQEIGGREKFPSGNLFVTDSRPKHQKGKVKEFWFASRSLSRTELVLVRGSAIKLY